MRLQTRHALRSFLTACVFARGHQEMKPNTSDNGDRQVHGIIQSVDPINRELTLGMEGSTATFYVPLDCSIILNDERVKMRLLQPMDRAVVRFLIGDEPAIAYSIVVDWATHYSRSQTPESAARPATGLMEYA